MPRPSPGALAAPLLLLTLAACAGGGADSASEVRAQVADQMVESGLDATQADCFAEIVVDELGVDEVNDLDFSSDEPPAGHEDEFAAAALEALSECDFELGSLDR